MTQELTILAARRSYEFQIDYIRLAALSTPPVRSQIQEAFAFQASGVGSPIATFGPVLAGSPAGVVFDAGFVTNLAGALTPIRFVHFEPTRIVLDVVGPSTEIDVVVDRLRSVLDTIALSSGPVVHWQPVAVREFSELIVTMALDLDQLVSPVLTRTVRSRFRAPGEASKAVAGLIMQELPLGSTFTPWPADQFTLMPRTGTVAGAAIFYSGAPLATQEHAAYLAELAQLHNQEHPRNE